MKIVWSIPVRGERLGASRGDLVRAQCLIDALRSHGHEIRVVEDAGRRGAALTVSAYRNLVRRVLPRKLSWTLRDLGRGIHALGHGVRVASEARRLDAEVIIETQVGFAASGALAARLSGLPLILDDCSPSSEESVLGAGLPALARYVWHRQMRAATSVVAVSRAMRDALIAEGIPDHKICLVPNGIDVEAFRVQDGQRLRAQLGLSHLFVVGFVGSFQPWHRVDLLVQAVQELARTYKIHALLAGEGPELESTMRLVGRLGLTDRFTMLGALPPAKIPTLVSSLDVGVLPGSNHYGHPMKLLDYAAAAIPSVAPDLGPVREVLRHDVTGLLFKTGDLSGLVNCLARLADSEPLRVRLGRSARQLTMVSGAWTERAQALVAAGLTD